MRRSDPDRDGLVAFLLGVGPVNLVLYVATLAALTIGGFTLLVAGQYVWGAALLAAIAASCGFAYSLGRKSPRNPRRTRKPTRAP